MTEKQRRIFEFIRDYYSKNKIMPTISEIANAFGYSASTVHEYLNRLVEKGYLIKRNFGWYEIPEEYLSKQLPFYGEIAAGNPLTIWEEPVEFIDTQEIIDCENCFVLRVNGSSMIEDGILNGDLIVVEPIQDAIYNGQTAVVVIDNEEATVKKVFKRGDEIELRPSNSDMASMFYPINRVKIVGKLKHLIRNYY